MKILGLLTILMGLTLHAETNEDKAKHFIQDLVQNGIASWKNKENPKKQANDLKAVMQTKFDIKNRIAARVAGKAMWPYLNDAQKADFVTAFEQMFLERYSKEFGSYDGQTMTIVQVVVDKTNTDQLIVSSEMTSPSGGQPLKVEWIVVQDSGFKIVDVLIANVSMAKTVATDILAVQKATLPKAKAKCKEDEQCKASELNIACVEFMNSNHGQ